MLRFCHSQATFNGVYRPDTEMQLSEKMRNVVFQPGKFGIRYKGSEIVFVREGTQAQQLGVEVGWKIKAISDQEMPDDTEFIMSYIKKANGEGNPIRMEFQLPSELPPEAPPELDQPSEIPGTEPATEASKGGPQQEDAPDGGAVLLLYLNTADKLALKKLPGIGEVKSQAILDCRDENGEFESVDDVLMVTGIGKKTLERLRAHRIQKERDQKATQNHPRVEPGRTETNPELTKPEDKSSSTPAEQAGTPEVNNSTSGCVKKTTDKTPAATIKPGDKTPADATGPNKLGLTKPPNTAKTNESTEAPGLQPGEARPGAWVEVVGEVVGEAVTGEPWIGGALLRVGLRGQIHIVREDGHLIVNMQVVGLRFINAAHVCMLKRVEPEQNRLASFLLLNTTNTTSSVTVDGKKSDDASSAESSRYKLDGLYRVESGKTYRISDHAIRGLDDDLALTIQDISLEAGTEERGKLRALDEDGVVYDANIEGGTLLWNDGDLWTKEVTEINVATRYVIRGVPHRQSMEFETLMTLNVFIKTIIKAEIKGNEIRFPFGEYCESCQRDLTSRLHSLFPKATIEMMTEREVAKARTQPRVVSPASHSEMVCNVENIPNAGCGRVLTRGEVEKHDEAWCDVCVREKPTGDFGEHWVLYGCRVCDWDVCLPCLRRDKGQAEQREVSTLLRTKLLDIGLPDDVCTAWIGAQWLDLMRYRFHHTPIPEKLKPLWKFLAEGMTVEVVEEFAARADEDDSDDDEMDIDPARVLKPGLRGRIRHFMPVNHWFYTAISRRLYAFIEFENIGGRRVDRKHFNKLKVIGDTQDGELIYHANVVYDNGGSDGYSTDYVMGRLGESTLEE